MPGAGVKALNNRIRSVKNTQQITKAMKMVAAAKLQRTQGRMLAARPYSRKLTQLMEQLSGAAEATHPLFQTRPVHRRLFVVITSDKGLAGAYNMNILRLARISVEASIAAGVETEVYAIGKKAADFLRKRNYMLFGSHTDFGGEATADGAHQVGDRMVRGFLEGRFDEVRIVFSEFVSTMRQTPVDVPMLPIAPEEARSSSGGAKKDYIWEPGPQEIFDLLVPLYLRNRVYMTLLEAYTSEHAARMTSMTAATENAGELIDALTLRRNRERQAAITAELLDIVGGANAL
ncbi:MAG: ATP synthase F1 subunit gamma [Candidatus Krumholzibacteriia bacterium]